MVAVIIFINSPTEAPDLAPVKLWDGVRSPNPMVLRVMKEK